MAIKEETREINGATYTVQQFVARRGLALKTKLIKLIAPSAFALIGGAKAQGGNIIDADIGADVLSKSIKTMLDNLGDSADVERLVFEILSNTRRNNAQIDGLLFDDVYAGNYGELFKAVFFVIEVNYGSFFRDMGIGNLQLPGSQDKKISQGKKPN